MFLSVFSYCGDHGDKLRGEGGYVQRCSSNDGTALDREFILHIWAAILLQAILRREIESTRFDYAGKNN